MLTKKQYLEWKKNDQIIMSSRNARQADYLIKTHTLSKFKKWVGKNVHPPILRVFVFDMVRCHFGSAEVDNLLTELNMYPDWM